MPVVWPQFIDKIKTIILDEMTSFDGEVEDAAKEFGKRVAEEYDAAISNAQSPTGQLWAANGVLDAMIKSYEDAFVLLVEEGKAEKNKIEDDLDEDGNKIPGTGKESNPEFADPDQDLPPPPVVDPEKLRNFVTGPSGAGTYKQDHGLHTFEYFEFHIEEKTPDTEEEVTNNDGTTTTIVTPGEVLFDGLKAGDDLAKVTAIVSTRLLYQFQFLSSNKRDTFLTWLNTLTQVPNDNQTQAKKDYFNNVKNTITSAGLNTTNSNGILDLMINVKNTVRSEIIAAYGYKPNTTIINTDQDNIEVTFPFDVRPLSRLIAAEDAHPDRPHIPPIMNKYFITYFTFTGADKAWNFTETQIEETWAKDLEDYYYDCPEVEEEADILSGTGGTLFSMSKQEVLDEKANAEDEESASPDPYEEIAKATILYWQSAAVQPLKASPSVPPCLITTPLQGIYIPISYGSATMLGNDIRKALNAGKLIEDNADLAATLVAGGLAVAYAKHLLMLKFIYAGGISTPVGPVPMIGVVPAVF